MSETILDVDSIIQTLLEAQYKLPGTEIAIPKEQIHQLIETVAEIVANQPVLLELEAPIKLCGTISLCS